MHFNIVDHVFWLASGLLLVGVILVMLRRKQNQEFPVFFTYAILQVSSDLVLAGLERFSYTAYFYTYWMVTVLCILMSFAVISELFRAACERFSALREMGKLVFRWAVLVVIVTAAGAVLTSHHKDFVQRIIGGILLVDRSARAMLCALVILLLLGKRYLDISWRSLLFGIALGFAVFTLARVALDSVALLGPRVYVRVGRINSVVYSCACAIWLAYVSLSGRRQIALATPAGADLTSGAEDTPAGAALDTLDSMVDRSFRQ